MPARLLAVCALVAAVAAAAALVAAALPPAGATGTASPGAGAATVGALAVRGAGVAVEVVAAPAVVPAPAALAAARRHARRRQGDVSFAVVDSAERLHCHRCARRHPSASVSKAMLLLARLRQRPAAPVPAPERRLLDRMVRVSDNAAADAVFARVGGDRALARLARRSDLVDFAPAGTWADVGTSARDQARLLARLGSLTPRRHRAFARRLLRTVAPEQSWGVPSAARPRGWRVLHKAGWRPSATGTLIHQAARLERGGRMVTIAVLTDGNRDHAYGTATVAGIARRLLSPPRG